jgi:murein DD-endopeptidase MepM/ murein hydrolase activator NlpD
VPTDTAPRRRRDIALAAAVVGVVALVPALVAAYATGSAAASASTSARVLAPLAAAPRPLLESIEVDRVSPELAEARDAARVSRADRAWVMPVARYRLTARFGESGSSWQFRHTGLDFQAPTGTPVRAVADSRVVAVAYHPLYGRMVVLETRSGVTLWYCHLSAVAVAEGDRVRAGQRVGRIGTTGNSTGPHLHFEVRVADRPTDPAYYLSGKHRGHTTTPPGWLPPQPITTVAALAAQQ